jgi:diguanylate cyclase (GGDEF)-like protein
MHFPPRSIRQFGLRVALPAIIVLIGAIATVVVSLNEMAGEVNRIEDTLTERAARAAVQSSLRRLGETNGDYAQWDDAVRNLYGTVDQDFVEETFVASTEDPVFFDTVYVIDETGTDVFGYRHGEPAVISSSEAFGSALAPMLAALPSDGRTYGVETGMLRSAWGLATVAAGTIVPNTAGFADPLKRSRILIFAKAFDEPAVNRLGEDFVIDGLRLADAAQSSMAIVDPLGNTVGGLAWSAGQLGSRAHARVSPWVFLTLGLLVITVAVLIVFALRGVREIKRREAHARHLAMHDSLTGLPNRTALIHSLDHAIAERRRSGTAVAVVFFDLDGFKEVNDAYGHQTGDSLLGRVATGFKALSGEHLLARIGGDEFALVVSGEDATREATDIARSFIGVLAEPFNIDGRVIVVGTSVGIAIADAIDPTAEEALRRADVAMYEAKQQGPNRIFVYDPAIDQIRQARLEIADDLRRAIKGDKLDLAYQPIFDAATREVVGVEALLRWNRAGLGPISPAVFVPIAEESGLMNELGAWTLRRACQDARAWTGIHLAVNVSPAQFRNPAFESVVTGILEETGFPASRLEVEVTETYFIEHPDQARKAIDAVRRLGISVALDDFGTGYSSIGYLRNFSFDRLKLDRSMIADIGTDERVQKLVHATVALAEALGLQVTAEGVETEEEALMLRLTGCREFQGFLFARPCRAAEVADYLRPTFPADLAEAVRA